MRVTKLTAYHVRLPLRRPFAHASHVRYDSDNVVIRCTLADGTQGWGEGVPREYVTGETAEGALQQLAASPLAEQLGGDCQSWRDVIELCDRFHPPGTREDSRGNRSNALRCAVELSLLDAFGKLFGQPVARVVEHVVDVESILSAQRSVRYGTVIGSGGKLRIKAFKMRVYGFRQCKLKVGEDLERDLSRVRVARRWLGSQIDLRLDANEAWRPQDLPEFFQAFGPHQISCVEQPCRHAGLEELARIKSELQLPIMLDESLTSLHDAELAIDWKVADLFNIRLSKCGGFLNSLRLAATADRAGLGYQLGCHPGESGILSAAGRHWASSVGGIRYLEGSYDRHVLRKLLTNEDFTFGYGGLAPAIDEAGLGVTVNETSLRELTQGEQMHVLG